jgi:hypothetical protein
LPAWAVRDAGAPAQVRAWPSAAVAPDLARLCV